MKRTPKYLLFRHLILIAIGFVLIYPVIFMVFASFKSSNEIFTSKRLLPEQFLWMNYPNGWISGGAGKVNFSNFFLNTFILVIPVVVFTVLSCSVVAYGFARFNFPFRRILFPIMIATMMLPNTVIIIPRFILFKKFNWLNTYMPFYAPALFACYPFFIFMIIQFMRNIPISLDESAKLDGCTSLQTFLYIMVPLLKPALISAGLFQFMWNWNDFYNQLIFINTPKKYTIALGLRLSIDASTEAVRWNEVMAMSVCTIIPLFLLFFSSQKYFVEGTTTSGIKG
ncbi:MAG: carbohydrate ABC transporter permease [Peptococcales bacterium]|jgi:oligogalacturonide transport system permease protein